MNNRQRILDASIELFNQSGTVLVTTNHIAKHLSISPGNLYFHFRSRENIVRDLFKLMSIETGKAWSTEFNLTPLEFISRSYEVFWRYRFFHREMYHLRRMDPELAKLWKRHINRCVRLLKLHYARWVKTNEVRSIGSIEEMRMLVDCILLYSSASLNFFESQDKPAKSNTLKVGVESTLRLIWPYLTQDYRKQVVAEVGFGDAI